MLLQTFLCIILNEILFFQVLYFPFCLLFIPLIWDVSHGCYSIHLFISAGNKDHLKMLNESKTYSLAHN